MKEIIGQRHKLQQLQEIYHINKAEEGVLNEAFKKNLSKLKREFTKLADKGIENRILEEILGNKQEMINKIKTTIQKMSKKLLK